MQMGLINIVHVFRSAVAGMPHITDHIPCQHYRPFFQFRLIGKALAQMSIIVIPLLIKASDADPPAAVLVPAQRFHIAGFDGDDRCTKVRIKPYTGF